MPGYLLPIGSQFFDDNGAPVAGGKLHAYIAGTATPQDIFTTALMDVPHANPAILDAAGRLIAFIADGVGYKFILDTALDVQVETWNEIQIPNIVPPPVAAEVPAGGIILFGGSAAPTGYLLCDGTAVSRTTYAALFAVIGTTYGVGNGSTTFNVPDLRQRFPLGKAAAGTGAALGATGGAIDHVHTGPSHTHTVNAHTHTIAHTHTVARTGFGPALVGILDNFLNMMLLSGGGGGGTNGPTTDATTSASSAANSGGTALTTNAEGTGNTSAQNPPFVTVNYVVKT
jgi:microcystin-dependent protein